MLNYGKLPLASELGLRPMLLKWLPGEPAHAYRNPTGDLAGLRAWQRKARQAFEQCLGQPIPKVDDARPRTLERRQMEGYTRTTFTLATGPGMRALAWLLLPDGASSASPLPAMIATPGHGLGGKDILAMDATGNPRPEGEGYQKDYAIQAVRHGLAVLVIEPLGFGERRDAMMADPQHSESGCHAASTLATMLGTTLARIRIHDIQCGLDHLQTLPMIDAKRVGMMGISGGGQTTLWTLAIEKRLKLGIVSGYLNSFRHSVMGMHHCICNFIPGLAANFDKADLAMLACPRPILFQNGMKDPIFPIKPAREAYRKLHAQYEALGLGDRVEMDVFKEDHVWSPRRVGPFLDRWL